MPKIHIKRTDSKNHEATGQEKKKQLYDHFAAAAGRLAETWVLCRGVCQCLVLVTNDDISWKLEPA